MRARAHACVFVCMCVRACVCVCVRVYMHIICTPQHNSPFRTFALDSIRTPLVKNQLINHRKEGRKPVTTRTMNIKVAESHRVQSHLRTLQLALSPVVGNKVTKTVSRGPTVENNSGRPKRPSNSLCERPAPPRCSHSFWGASSTTLSFFFHGALPASTETIRLVRDRRRC